MEQFFNFKLILILFFVSNATFIFASIFYRAWKGKRHLAIPEFDIEFSEKWVSGFSHQGAFNKLARASNCLVVELSKKALVIRTMFPFNLTFLPQFYDLEHFIPRDKIKSIQPAENGDRSGIVIEFESAGVVKRVEVSLKKRQEFMRALGHSYVRHPVPSGILT